MRARIVRLSFVLLVAFAAARVAFAARTLTVNRVANLRHDASTSSAIVGHLAVGDELTLLDDKKTQGFYHVQTAAGQDGWVYETLVHVDEADEPIPSPDASGADAVSADWTKPAPVGSTLAGPPGADPCPAAGEPGGDTGTNTRKNRIDVPTSYHPLAFSALAKLAYPDAPTKRKKWSADQLAQIAPYEGVGVSVVGFIVAVKKQSGGSGEETNCHFTLPDFVDVHVALAEHAGDGEKTAVVVEVTPRFYAKHPTWTYDSLKKLDDTPNPVRISGWTLLDPVHKGQIDTYRTTLWEIHPITRIEIYKNGAWSDW